MPSPEAQQRAHDALLRWVSELGWGSWERLREACEQLRLAPGRAIRGLSVLGHAEMSWRARRFACAPATLTTIPAIPGRLLLCGARHTGLLSELGRLASEHELDVDVEPAGAHQFGLGPTTVLIDADPATAGELCDLAGLRFCPQAAEAIATALPAVRFPASVEPASPDERFPRCPLDPDTLEPRWDAAGSGGYADGLWSWEGFQGRRSFLRRDGDWFHVPVREHGPYLVERPAGAPELLRHDPANRLLYVNARAPLPELHARAACLCSGRLPLRQHYAADHAEDQYVNVPRAVAEPIVASLTGGAR